MVKLFIPVMHMSITASFVVIAVILIRLCLKKAPGIFSYLLWIPVLVRFLIPVSLESDLGIIPAVSVSREEETYTRKETKAVRDEETLQGNAPAEGEPVYLPAEGVRETEYIYKTEEGSPVEVRIAGKSFEIAPGVMKALAFLWGLTALLLILYETVSYGIFTEKLNRENGSVTKEREGHRNLYIRVLDSVKEPFITGFFCPVIYLPSGLKEGQRELILEHEKVHIRRLDHLIKPTALLICCVYWFNPFAWLSFYLMEHDMESSCDEAVMRKVGYDRKKEYAETLLCLAERKVWNPGRPIAFGENNVVSRIKNAVRLKKTAAWIVTAAAVVAVGSAALLLVNRPKADGSEPAGETQESASELVLLEETADSVETLPKENRAGENIPKEPMPEVQENTGSSGYRGSDGVPGVDVNEAAEYVISPDTGERNTNYDPSRDKFEVLLLTGIEDAENAEAHSDELILYSYPLEYSRISDDFGTRIHPVTKEEKFHSGIDFAADQGTPITAAADGSVVSTGYDADCGNYIILRHGNGDMTYYACCETILLEEGSDVKRGEQIATVGSTGRSTGYHLHFAVSRDGSFVRPGFEE